jgi:hypothetical protein
VRSGEFKCKAEQPDKLFIFSWFGQEEQNAKFPSVTIESEEIKNVFQ